MLRKSLKAILRGEELECRVVPAKFRLLAGDGGWTNDENWEIYNAARLKWEDCPEGDYPGNGRTTDDVEFWAGAQFTGRVLLSQSITLHSLNFKRSSGSTILFNGAL
jgi:hypothetical protein